MPSASMPTLSASLSHIFWPPSMAFGAAATPLSAVAAERSAPQRLFPQSSAAQLSRVPVLAATSLPPAPSTRPRSCSVTRPAAASASVVPVSTKPARVHTLPHRALLRRRLGRWVLAARRLQRSAQRGGAVALQLAWSAAMRATHTRRRRFWAEKPRAPRRRPGRDLCLVSFFFAGFWRAPLAWLLRRCVSCHTAVHLLRRHRA